MLRDHIDSNQATSHDDSVLLFGLNRHRAWQIIRDCAGRLSSSEPNLQNIPVRGDLGGQVRQYLDSTKEQARTTGYVQTLLGRRRFIPDINSSNRQVRESAERMAINMPVQGTSADIIKVAMINLYREMAERWLKSQMLLQVHDELVFEVPEEEMAAMRKLVSGIMSAAVSLSIPLKVDIKEGKNWGEMK